MTPHPLLSPRRCLRWIARFRHRCGYGIHSPFAFSFVTEVLYCPGAYYADAQVQALAAHGTPCGLRPKDCHLLFRLANFAHPATCLLSGISPDSPEARLLALGSRHTRFVSTPQPAEMIVAAPTLAAADTLLPLLREGGMLVLIHPRRTHAALSAWQQLCSQPESGLCFDLYDFGIVLHRTDLPAQHYTINYL